MKHVPIKLVPLALLLTVITICLAVLAILTFATARADLALAERYAQTLKDRYELEKAGQQYLAWGELDGEKVFEKDGMRLTVIVDENGNVTCWTVEKEWVEDDVINDLWPGD